MFVILHNRLIQCLHLKGPPSTADCLHDFFRKEIQAWLAGLIPHLVETLSLFLHSQCMPPLIYMAVTKRNPTTYIGLEKALKDADMASQRLDVNLDQCSVRFLDVLDEIRSDVHLIFVHKISN